MIFDFMGNNNGHSYYLFCSGADFKAREFGSRRAAEIAMNEFCATLGIQVECVECDKHERMYESANGVRFYINRI